MKNFRPEITKRSNMLQKSTQEVKAIYSEDMTVEKSLVMDIMRCLIQNFGNNFNSEIDDIKNYYETWFEVDYDLFRELYRKEDIKLFDVDTRVIKRIVSSIADTKIKTFDKLSFEVMTIFPTVKVDAKRNLFMFTVNPLFLRAMISSGKIIGDDNIGKIKGSFISYDYIKLHKNYGFTYTETALYQFLLSDKFKLKLGQVGYIEMDKLKGMCNIKTDVNNRLVETFNKAFYNVNKILLDNEGYEIDYKFKLGRYNRAVGIAYSIKDNCEYEYVYEGLRVYRKEIKK